MNLPESAITAAYSPSIMTALSELGIIMQHCTDDVTRSAWELEARPGEITSNEILSTFI